MAAPDDHMAEVKPSYRRVELDCTLDVDEVKGLLVTGSGADLVFEFKIDPKTTNGKPDEIGKHYSTHNWRCRVRLQRHSWSTSYKVRFGVTDFENFPGNKKGSTRRKDHRHFFVSGSPEGVEQVPESLKGAMTRRGRRIW